MSLGLAREAAFIVVVACAAIAALLLADRYYLFLISLTAIATIAAIGLNILAGLSGQISLGHGAFLAIGAYSLGLLTGLAGFGFWSAFLSAGAICSVAGLLLALPALRAEGPYLAMVTMAFGFIVEQGLAEWKSLTGGWNGLSGIEMPSVFGAPFSDRAFAALIVFTLGLSFAFFRVLKSSALGLAMIAVRDAPIAAQSCGINTVMVRTAAFVISAGLTGLAGAYFASLNTFISPESFPFFQSIALLLIVVIGGAASAAGPVFGAFIVIFVPEILSSLAQYRVLAIGILFLAVLRLTPEGLAGLIQDLRRHISKLNRQHHARLEKCLTFELPLVSSPQGLSVKGLDVRFHGVHAVKSLSFDAAPGQITSLVGPNGAGKSTAVNLICGFYRPDAGAVFKGEVDITGLKAHKLASIGIARTFQTSQPFAGLSVLDNIRLAARATSAGGIGAVRAEGLLAFCGFTGDVNVYAGGLPHVDRRLLEIARALSSAPSVLLLDEPAAGLDRADKLKLARLLKAVANSGVAVLLIEHDMDLVASVSDKIVVLDAGAKLAEGKPSAVLADPKVRQAYLGARVSPPPQSTAQTSPEKTMPIKRMLSVRAVSAGYGEMRVLNNISLEVRHGEIIAILGANGAGKTTLLRALSGLRPVVGEINFEGSPVQSLTANERSRRGLVLVPEGRQIFSELSVADNLLIAALHRTKNEAEHAAEQLLRRFPKLAARRDQQGGLLSGGEQQMLAIARGLIAQPKLLMLDEPSLGLAPLIVEEVYELLASLKEDGQSIIIADQLAAMALTLADRAYVLRGGSVFHEAPGSELLANPLLLEAYLGEGVATA